MILILQYFGHGVVVALCNKSTAKARMTIRPAHLLIIDDEEVSLRLTKRGLEKFEYQVTTFNCAQEALKSFKLGPHVYDLVITDKSMPRLSGFELLKSIREVKSDIPVILFTGFISEEEEQSLQKLIKDIKIVLKPIRMQELQSIVKTMLP